MTISKIIRSIYRLRFLNGLTNTCFKPGHFYSPIVSLREVKKREDQIWPKSSKEIAGINLFPEKQTDLLNKLSTYYKDLPFTENKEKTRFYFENIFFSYTDAIFLFFVIRHFKPERIIEVGSGFSSALMLDTAQHFLPSLSLSFIEPFTKRLKSLINESDKKNVEILESKIQDIELSYFETLNKDDILFIDSTHVSKTGSDVNYVLFNILPRLKKGVLIHIHDIFYPFEYSKKWVYQGRSWNESYILRAFLMHNNDYEIILFADYLHKHHKNSFDKIPLCNKNTGGSIWLKKLTD